MKPHKHAELIKAWADGATIERYSWTEQKWKESNPPEWLPDSNYRIKPEPKQMVTRWLWVYRAGTETMWRITTCYYTKKEFEAWCGAKGMPLAWSEMEFGE
jgi:hypothetical protein